MVSSAGILSFDKSGLSGAFFDCRQRSNLTLLNAMRSSALVMDLNSQINFTLHYRFHSSCNSRQCWRINIVAISSNLRSVWLCTKQIYHSFSQNFFSRDMKTAGLVQFKDEHPFWISWNGQILPIQQLWLIVKDIMDIISVYYLLKAHKEQDKGPQELLQSFPHV